jgi:hypothetical protein
MNIQAYPVRVDFTRKFTSGTLNGLTNKDSLGFPSQDAAQGWINTMKNEVNPCAGSSKYVILDAQIKVS